VKIKVQYTNTYEDSIMKSTNMVSRRGEEEEGEWTYNVGGELVSSTLCTYME
jgi:hypothetical protein